MRVMALFSTSFFAKYLRVGEDDGPGRGHLCHTDTFLVFFSSILVVLFENQGTSKCLNMLFLLSPHLCFIIGFICDLSVARNDSLVN